MSQYAPISRRKSWIRRHKFLAIGAGALVLIVLAVVPLPFAARAHADYNDPGQLAQALKAQEHGAVSADCVHTAGPRYDCAVGFPGGSLGSYTVTVSADGSHYTAS